MPPIYFGGSARTAPPASTALAPAAARQMQLWGWDMGHRVTAHTHHEQVHPRHKNFAHSASDREHDASPRASVSSLFLPFSFPPTLEHLEQVHPNHTRRSPCR
jgi:hypothetical protein